MVRAIRIQAVSVSKICFLLTVCSGTASQLLLADQVIVLDNEGNAAQARSPNEIISHADVNLQNGNQSGFQRCGDTSGNSVPPVRHVPNILPDLALSGRSELYTKGRVPFERGNESSTYAYYASSIGWIRMSIFIVCLCIYSSGLTIQGKCSS